MNNSTSGTPTKGKWEARADRFFDWIEKKSAATQALITTVAILFAVIFIFLLVVFCIKVLGWATVPVGAVFLLYLKLYFSFKEQKGRGY